MKSDDFKRYRRTQIAELRCDECDVSFDCWGGIARCCRLPTHDTAKMRAAAPLLPPPGDEVVVELCDTIDALRSEAERLRARLAVSQQSHLDLTEMTAEAQDRSKRLREQRDEAMAELQRVCVACGTTTEDVMLNDDSDVSSPHQVVAVCLKYERDQLDCAEETIRELRKQLDPESVQHWDSMRRERDEARAERDFFDAERMKLVELLEGDGGALAECDALRAEVERLRRCCDKVNAIRNSIVGAQKFNFSEHAYPLVAALNEAGFDGLPYPEARKNVGTLIDQRDTAEHERDALRAEVEQLRETLRILSIRTVLGWRP